MQGQQSPAKSAESAKLNRLGNAGQELRAAASLRDQGRLKLRSLHRPKDRAAPEESAGAKGFAELAEVPGSAPQTDSDGHKSCGAGRIGSATMNSNLPEGSAVPGTEEDTESARASGPEESATPPRTATSRRKLRSLGLRRIRSLQELRRRKNRQRHHEQRPPGGICGAGG